MPGCETNSASFSPNGERKSRDGDVRKEEREIVCAVSKASVMEVKRHGRREEEEEEKRHRVAKKEESGAVVTFCS